jgi:PAS domain S-box-containing protein
VGEEKKPPLTSVPPRRSLWIVLYLTGAVVISVVGALAAPAVSPAVLAIVLIACLSAMGVLILLTQRRHKQAFARWRDVMPCYLSIQDKNLKITDTNNLFRRDFGERVGEYCYKAYKGNDAPCPDCPVLQSFKDGLVHSGEETVRARDGTVANVVVTSAPLFNTRGEVAAVVEMSTNVTKMKALQHEMEESRRNYQRLFESVPCYICVLDRDLRIRDSNELYRWAFGNVDGRHCYEACKRRKSECPECLVQATFADGQVHSSEEVLKTRGGQKFDLVVYSMPIRNDRGEIASVMEVFTDITDVKKLQRQLTLMGRAVAGMAHRIKNILMGLEGGIYVVNNGMESNDQAQVAEGWEMVERNVKTVSAIVKDLLFCSKKRRPKYQPDVCPQDIMQQVYDLYVRRVANDDIELRLELSEPRICSTFDPDGLHNLLSNLVANAIDACRFDTSEKKTGFVITLRCRQEEDGTTVFEVEDNGAGIPEEHSGKVFEEFFSTKGTEGTGVGLLVVQKVAEEHRGGVTFSTQAGRGTRFRVTVRPANRQMIV